MFNPSDLVGKQIDQFRLDRYIASGAMGSVYKATDLVLDRPVALKLISKSEDLGPAAEEARRRLIKEAQAAGRLSHENIVTIHSYGETEDYQYICMAYVEGRTLAEILRERKLLPIEEGFVLFEQILGALDAASRVGIVHRDIKPSNILIGRDGRAQITDFGIAKFLSVSMTVTGMVMGTPYYMSPEQVSGRKVDTRSDIFSVGAVMYEVLTGVKPFDADSTITLAYKIVQQDPVPPNVINMDMDLPVAGVIQKALAKDPGQRYQTAMEMLYALRASMETRTLAPETTVNVGNPALNPIEATVLSGIGGRAISSARPTPAPRVVKKRPTFMLLMGACLLILVLLGGGVYMAFYRIHPATAPSEGARTAKNATSGEPAAVAVTAPSETSTVSPAEKAKNPDGAPEAGPSQAEVPKPQEPAGPQEPAAGTPAANSSAGVVAQALILEAKNQWESNPAGARKLLEQAVSLQPDSFEAVFQLARFCTFHKDYDNAVRQYQAALRINNQVPEIYFNLGFIYHAQGNYDLAIESYEACRALSPPYQDEVLTNLGILYIKNDNPEKARVLLKQALELNPKNGLARSYLTKMGK